MRRGSAYTAVVMLVVAGGLGGITGVAVRRHTRAAERAAAATHYKPSAVRTPGRQIVMVYLGKAGCSWSNRPQMPGIVEAAKFSLNQRARERGLGFEAIGVALDWSAPRGLTHLAKFGDFDEVAAGASWGNSLGLKYVGGPFGGEAATPQILVLSRRIGAVDSASVEAIVDIADEQLVMRKVGLYEIEQWAKGGYRVAMSR